MTIEHNKISGIANTSPSQVGGADWDAAHVLGAGSLFPLGLLRMSYNYASDWCQNTLAAGAPGGWTRSGGQFSRELLVTPPVRSGAVVQFYAIAVRVTGLPAGWTWNVSDGGYLGQNDLIIETLNTSGVVTRPTQNFSIELLLMAEVS